MSSLPPGQRKSDKFHRFGLTPFAKRFPKENTRQLITFSGLVEQPITIESPLEGLPRTIQTSDFHCVTTWSFEGLTWEGVRFVDFYQQTILPRIKPNKGAVLVALKAQDGARTGMLLEDLLDPSVLLVDKLDGTSLSECHGGPLRLVAPKHYGYKSVKYLKEMTFLLPETGYQVSGFKFMDHLRARVAYEERGRFLPGILLRYIYRPLINKTAKLFDYEWDKRNNKNSQR